MGKGNRNKQSRTQDQFDNPENYLETSKKQSNGKKSRRGKDGLAVKLTCIVIALIILGAFIVGVFAADILESTGVFLRSKEALVTENFEVDGAMMNFFFNNSIMTWYTNNSTYVDYGLLSVDFSRNLKNQTVGSSSLDSYVCGSFTGTWYDYFLTELLSDVTAYLEYAEGAKAMGLELTDEDYEEIDGIIENIESSMKASGANYGIWYGSGVKRSDVRRCYEIVLLAEKFVEAKTDELEAALDKETDTVTKYPEDHKENFYSAEYLSYKITVKSSDFTNDEEFNNAKDKAKEDADKIAGGTTPEEFYELILEYVEALEAEKSDDDKDEKEEEHEHSMDDYKGTISYATKSDLEKWIFTDNAEVNSVKVIESTTESDAAESETTSDSTENKKVTTYTVTAYMITEASSLDTERTKDIGYVITNDKALAEQMLAEFKAGTMTSEALSKLGQAKYDALEEDSKTEIYCDAVEKVSSGYFDYYFGMADIDEWLGKEDLSEGMCSEVIEIKPAKEGDPTYYAVCYFEKYNKEVWYLNAYSSIISERFDEWYKGSDGNGGQLAKTPVKKNNEVLNNIYVFSFGSSLATY